MPEENSAYRTRIFETGLQKKIWLTVSSVVILTVSPGFNTEVFAWINIYDSVSPFIIITDFSLKFKCPMFSVNGDNQAFRRYCNHVWYKCNVSSEIRFGHLSLWRQFSENSFTFLYFISCLFSIRVKIIYTRQNKTQTTWCLSVFLFYIRHQCGSSL